MSTVLQFLFLVLHLSNNHLGEEENFEDKLVSFEGFHHLSLQTAFDKPVPGWIKHWFSTALLTLDRLLFLELNLKMCCLTWQGQRQPHRSCCQQWACWGCGPSPHTPGQETAAQLATSSSNSYHVKTEEGLKERVSGVHHVGPPVDEDWRVAQTVDGVRSEDGQ